MGLDATSIKFLQYVNSQLQKLGCILTIGRQAVDPLVCQGIWRNELLRANIRLNYCEDYLIKKLGAKSVDALDISDYEGANVLHDMNQAIPHNLQRRWDTVIDGGSLEHIFNFPQALTNCSSLCKLGGQIIHLVPGNNCLNHGFYQFSPDLFHQFYSEKNGYNDTEVFLSENSGSGSIYKVSPPTGGRIEMMSNTRIVILVRTRLIEHKQVIQNMFQKDYTVRWTKNIQVPSVIRKKIWNSPWLHRILRKYSDWLGDRNRRISPGNKNLKVVKI